MMLYPHSRGNDVTTNQDYIQMIVHWWGVSISLMLLLGTDRPSGHGIVQTRLVDHNRHLPDTFSLTSCRFCLLLTTDIFQSFGSIFRDFSRLHIACMKYSKPYIHGQQTMLFFGPSWTSDSSLWGYFMLLVWCRLTVEQSYSDIQNPNRLTLPTLLALSKEYYIVLPVCTENTRDAYAEHTEGKT